MKKVVICRDGVAISECYVDSISELNLEGFFKVISDITLGDESNITVEKKESETIADIYEVYGWAGDQIRTQVDVFEVHVIPMSDDEDAQ